MPTKTEVNCKTVEVVKKIKEEVFNVRWTIENFTETYLLTRGDLLESNEFEIEDNVFSLMLNCPESNDDDFSFFLQQYFKGRSWVEIDCKAWLEDIDGNKYYESEIDNSDYVEYYEIHHYFKQSLQKQDLGTIIKLKNDTAIFCAAIRQKMPGEEIVLPKVDLKLLQKLWDSCQRGLIDGINIQVEGKTFKVSKNILAINSDVFERMLLTENCKEVQEGVIEIKEARYEIMKVFVEYLHMGQLENLPDVCDELFVLANRYLVVPLQKDCAEEMVKSLDNENLFGRLQMAFLYNQENLKNAVLDYITSKNSELNFRQIMKSDEWTKLENSNKTLANEITDAVYDKMQWLPEQDDDSVPNKRQKLD